MYNEIKQNFIEKFFNKNFRYCTLSNKKALIDKMYLVFPFDYSYNDDLSVLTLHLGDNVNIDFKLDWNISEHSNGHKLYRLNKIS